eukprot:TRINITY_DN1927_c0_g1_i1.p2 TRINITY_DN1927_c0_g1~~TRINITY_DN1927_c0_g1_i1.p2  ORF type:complete len:107 (+),score=22.60 TRINITY_DN1927_c0_g1_i1:182-502(+)
MEDGEVQQAASLLLRVKYCRRQAAALARCIQTGGSCEDARAAFATCSEMKSGDVVRAMVAVASKNCSTEVAAFERCKRERGEDECGSQDLAALTCAARLVLHSAKT